MAKNCKLGGHMRIKVICATVMLFVMAITVLVFAQAEKENDIKLHKNCKHCNMDREKFNFSRMLIEYEDGTSAGLCSIRCAAVELSQNKGRKVKSLLVADYATKKLTDARTATWVIGGKQQGVMTSVPKWAFSRQEDAQKFTKESGGKIASFDEAIKAAEDETGNRKKTSHAY
ncbi:MAG: NosL family protein [Thermodesulfovibrio sp.]|nr:NosL family protein [Thermodesulfovibrio sp.]